MTTEELMNMLNPSVLVYFERRLLAANGTLIVGDEQLAAIQLRGKDSWGEEIGVWTSPTSTKPAGGASPNEVAERIRPATADEDRTWLRLGEPS